MALVPANSNQDPELVAEVRGVLTEIQNLLAETRAASNTNKWTLRVAVVTLFLSVIVALFH